MIVMRKTKRYSKIRDERVRMIRKPREHIIATVTAVGREKDDG
jgi:hypothetical protein